MNISSRARGLARFQGAARLLLGLLLVFAATAAFAQQQTSQPPGTSGEGPAAAKAKELAEKAAAARAAADAAAKAAVEAEKAAKDAAKAAEAETAEPEPERDWKVDLMGRRYYVEKIRKPAMWTRIDEETVRLRYGMILKLVDEDEDYFYYKMFDTKPVEPARKEPSEEELAAAAATYEAEELPSGDKLELVPFDEGLPKSGLWRHGFDVADMNGDGHLDIVHGSPRKLDGTPPRIFLGNSLGSWRLWEEATFPEEPYDYGDVAVADFDGDGRQDVVLGMHARGLLVLVQESPGKFKSWSRGIELERPGHSGVPAFTSREVEAVDWNGDGRPDVVGLAEGPRGIQHVELPGATGIVVYLNQGDGTWKKVEEEEPLMFGYHLELADMNRDGRTDFVTSSSRYASRDLVDLHQEDDTWQKRWIDAVRPFGWIWAVAVDDFDGDGRQDIAYSYLNQELKVQRWGLEVLLAREAKTPEEAQQIEEKGEFGVWERRMLVGGETSQGRTDIFSLDAGDLDGDGRLDLVASTSEGQLLIFRGTAGGRFEREEEPERAETNPGCRGYGLLLTDLDGDERPEVIASYSGEECRPAGGGIYAWKAVVRSGAS